MVCQQTPPVHQLSSSALQVPADTHKHGEDSHGRLLTGRSQHTDQGEAGRPQVTTTVATPTPQQKEGPRHTPMGVTNSGGEHRFSKETDISPSKPLVTSKLLRGTAKKHIISGKMFIFTKLPYESCTIPQDFLTNKKEGSSDTFRKQNITQNVYTNK